MSGSLPERPDLEQLRRRAKELRDAARLGDVVALQRFALHHRAVSQGTAGLAAAQLVIARELGFASWPELKGAVDAELAWRANLSSFITASIEGRLEQATDIFRDNPGVARRSLIAASVLGDVTAVQALLADNPSEAVTIDHDRGWPPLLYACYSRWHQADPGRAPGMAEVVRALLDAGASPNTNDGGRPRYRSALRGSVEVNNPEITEVLLDAGADPNPGQPVAEAAGHRDLRCLQLLLAHGARVAGTWAIGAAVFNDNAAATSLLLGALEAAGDGAAEAASQALPEAAAAASLSVVVALLDAGADPRARDSDGVTALRHAVRAGKNDVAERLTAVGAAGDDTEVDRFIGACLNADRHVAEQLLADHPGLRDRLTDKDRSAIVEAASWRTAEAITLMLDLGFSTADRNDFGEQPLHSAAYAGNATVVRLLLERGADVDGRDQRFDSTPLAFATVGSGEQAGKPGDWVETVDLLVQAGATRDGAWVAGKPPSDEVMELVRRYGITRDEPPEGAEDGATDLPAVIGTGVMADIAHHLEAAHRHLDLDLLGSLLHPEVRWTGLCLNSAQVLDWYRALLADGTRAAVESVEVDGDAVLLGLSVRRQAEGARPAAPERVYQVFTVENAQIVEIRGYPDRASALSRE